MDDATKAAISIAQSVLPSLLSWAILAAISIIVSGKLIAKRLPVGLQDDAKFSLPLIIFSLQAKGEEVSLGFLSFILSLSACIFVGGNRAYLVFKTQSGVDIGQWDSLCVIASFLSLIFATAICIAVPWIKGSPVIDDQDRTETLQLLGGQKRND